MHISPYRTFIAVTLLVVTSAASEGKKPLLNEPSRDELAEYAASFEPRAKAFPSIFRFPDDVRSDKVFGIDVSHYQGDVRWEKVAKQGVTFVYIKATQGQQLYDPKFVRNWEMVGKIEANDASLHRGAYHFMTADDAPNLQAQNFLDTMGKLQENDLPACLDLEWDFLMRNGKLVLDHKGNKIDQWETLSSGEIIQRVTKWLELVEAATGKQPIIYTSYRWWSERVRSNSPLDEYVFWIADHTSKSLGREDPTVPQGLLWSFWQLTDRGILSKGGIRQGVDTTIYHGTAKDLEKRFGFK